MKILLIGHVCIDINNSEHASYTSGGSPLLYMGNYLKRNFKIDPLLIAPYGRDFLPYAAGLQLLTPPHRGHTLVNKNTTRNHRKTKQSEHFRDVDPVPLTAEVKKRIAEADIICLAPLLPSYSVDYVRDLMAARKPSAVTLLSPQGFLRAVDAHGRVSPRRFTEAEDIIPLFDMVVFSEDDLPNALEMAQQWAMSAPKSQIIVTQDSRGASLVTTKGLIPVATTPVPEDHIVDSIGCGDTFSAAAIYSFAQNRDVAAAIKAGNEAARAKLFQAGAT